MIKLVNMNIINIYLIINSINSEVIWTRKVICDGEKHLFIFDQCKFYILYL